MPKFRPATAFAIASLALVASLSAPPAAFAVPLRALRALAPQTYSATTALPRTAVLNKAMELPMGTGGKLRGYLPGGTYDVYHVPLYAGQNFIAHWGNSTLTGGEIALYNRNIQQDALQYVIDGGERAWINYDATTFTVDGETRLFDFGYDLVIFAGPYGGSYGVEWESLDPVQSPWVNRINGSNRYSTAAMGSAAFRDPTTIVVATGTNFPDALAASALCGAYDAPLLLTSPKALSPEAKSVIDYERPDRIFVIGSAKTIPDSVVNAMKATGRTVERVAGDSRFETAVEIAKRVQARVIEQGGTPSTEALVVNGKNYPDALSASPYAFSAKMPILLVSPSQLPTSTHDAFAELGIDTVHVIGGDAVSQAVMDALPVATKDRIAGKDRCETSSMVASYAVDAGWADWNCAAIATGYNFPDGLAAGVNAGKQHGVMLLTKPLYVQETTYMSISDHREQLMADGENHETVRLWGSPFSISGFAFGEFLDAINGVAW